MLLKGPNNARSPMQQSGRGISTADLGITRTVGKVQMQATDGRHHFIGLN